MYEINVNKSRTGGFDTVIKFKSPLEKCIYFIRTDIRTFQKRFVISQNGL